MNLLPNGPVKFKVTLVELCRSFLIFLFIWGIANGSNLDAAIYDSMLSSSQYVIRFIASEELAAKEQDTIAALNKLVEVLSLEILNPISTSRAMGTDASITEFLKTNYCIAIRKLSVENEGLIKQYINNSKGELRERLLFVLGNLKNESVHKEIREISQTAQDPYIRLHAIEALNEYADTLDIPIFKAALSDTLWVADFIDADGKPINIKYPTRAVAAGALNKLGFDVMWRDGTYKILRER